MDFPSNVILAISEEAECKPRNAAAVASHRRPLPLGQVPVPQAGSLVWSGTRITSICLSLAHFHVYRGLGWQGTTNVLAAPGNK